MSSTVKVWLATIGGLTLGQFVTFFQIAAPAAALAFTIWQWGRAKKRADREDNDGR